MDLMQRRRVMLAAGKKPRLPREYQEVAWLESTGTQYIDNGRVPNNNDIIEQKFRKRGTSQSTCAWYGSMPSDSQILPRISIGSYKNGLFFGVNGTFAMDSSINTEVHTIISQPKDANSMLLIYDGISRYVSPVSQANTYSPTVTLSSYLFARHGSNGVQVRDNEGTCIYYHRERLSSGIIQLDFVPCYRKSDRKPGM